jgi:hypothetical protein
VNEHPAPCPKVTERLARLLEASNDLDRLEVIVTLTPDRSGVDESSAPDRHSPPQRERRRSQERLERFVASLNQVKEAGGHVTVLDVSWLADSALIRANPPVIRALAERDDVCIMDLNAEIGGVFGDPGAGTASTHG